MENTKKIVFTVFVIVLIVILSYSGIVSASTVTRSFSSNKILPCSSINVTLAVDVTGLDSYYAIDEIFPNGWNITNPGTGSTVQSGHIKWIVITGAADTSYRYSIQSPCVPGIYAFRGEYGFNESDIRNISGQATVNVSNDVDVTLPVITRLGQSPLNVPIDSIYNDAGAIASDNVDGNLTANITAVNPVNTSRVGTYTVRYNVRDSSGNNAIEVTRTVNVIDNIPPIIAILGSSTVDLVFGSTYNDAGAIATDNVDGVLTSRIIVNNSVNTSRVGTYTVRYNVKDNSGNNATEVIRTVNVVDTLVPSISLIGNSTLTLMSSSTYYEYGAIASDNVDGNLTADIIISSNVNTAIPGTYRVNYNISDSSGNSAGLVRIVYVFAQESIPPVLRIIYPISVPRFFNRFVNFTLIGDEFLSECKMSPDGGLTNFTMGAVGGNASRWSGTFISTLEGNVEVRFQCKDISGNINNSLTYIAPMSNPPLLSLNLSEWYLNETTNFSYYTKGELLGIDDVTFTNSFGKIEYLERLNITLDADLRGNIKITNRKMMVNSSLLSEFNKTAKLLFYGLNLVHPIIKKDGKDCLNACRNVTKVNSTIFFEVDGFSEYSIVEQCSDGMKDYDETGIDCGGLNCNECYVPPSSSGGGGGGGGGGSAPVTQTNITNSSYGISNKSSVTPIQSQPSPGVGGNSNPLQSDNNPVPTVPSQAPITGGVIDDGKLKKAGFAQTLFLFAIFIILGTIAYIYIDRMKNQSQIKRKEYDDMDTMRIKEIIDENENELKHKSKEKMDIHTHKESVIAKMKKSFSKIKKEEKKETKKEKMKNDELSPRNMLISSIPKTPKEEKKENSDELPSVISLTGVKAQNQTTGTTKK